MYIHPLSLSVKSMMTILEFTQNLVENEIITPADTFANLNNMHKVRSCLLLDSSETMVHASITSHLDYPTIKLKAPIHTENCCSLDIKLIQIWPHCTILKDVSQSDITFVLLANNISSVNLCWLTFTTMVILIDSFHPFCMQTYNVFVTLTPIHFLLQ